MSTVPQLVIRVLLDGEGRDLSARVNHDTLNKQILVLERSTARQVVKMQDEIIALRARQAEKLANEQLPALQQQARATFTRNLQQEIDRLKALQAINPAVRPQEIAALEHHLEQGLKHLQHLHLVSDTLRVIVAG